MFRISSGLTRATLVLALLGGFVQPVAAQSQDFFVPGQPRPGATPARPPQGPQGQAPAARPAQPARPPVQPAPQQQAQQNPEFEAPPAQLPMPPVPELPALPRGTSPPAAIIGVIGVPEVMRAATAAQLVDRVIGERREKLNDDAQKEQAAWRDMQQALASQRTSLSPEQLRNKERELQERITNAQRSFRDRNRIVQEAAQFSLNQIQASLIAVIRQVAESRGMNLVLHRQQVALNVNEFDITEQVADQLNKLLPSVTIPPDGVSPVAQAPAPAAPVQPATAPAATPPKK